LYELILPLTMRDRCFLAFLFSCLFLLLLSSCVSFYQLQHEFNRNFESGDIPAAEAALLKDKKAAQRKTRLLYFLNMGVVTSMQGKYEQSNAYFEQAYLLGEDYHRNYLNEAASFLLNPNIIEYKGEDFEYLMVNYYKALNYLRLGQRENALVECRRINQRLQKLSDKYTSANKFRRDAFVQLLMGLIFEASGEYNNAFISYRNALDIYESDYSKFFGLKPPQQLKKDLLRMAYLNGFLEDLAYWEKKLAMKHIPDKNKQGDLVFLWQNGLAPVKVEDGINFTIVRGAGGIVTFGNANFGFNFSFPVDDSTYYKSGLSALEFIRVVYPRYVERPVYYQSASLKWNDKQVLLEKAEDVNALAFKNLSQRRWEELGKALLRLALKKAAEYTLRNENKGAGAALGIFNALTEQADTRGWQSLPHSICYGRLSLPEGSHQVNLETQAAHGQTSSQSFTFSIKPGETVFRSFHSLETMPTSLQQGRF
jgi:hypothetical protein